MLDLEDNKFKFLSSWAALLLAGTVLGILLVQHFASGNWGIFGPSPKAIGPRKLGKEGGQVAGNADGTPALARDERTERADASRSAALSGDEIYQRVLKSTTWIVHVDRDSIAIGSGALVDFQQRLVITNFHVVRDSAIVNVCFPSHDTATEAISKPKFYLDNAKSVFITGRVVCRDGTRDLALIELESLPSDVQALTLASKSPSPGQTVHSIGASGVNLRTFEGVLWRHNFGVVRQVYGREFQYQDGQRVKAHIVETQSGTNPGDSGGPMVNDQAYLVAIVSGRDPWSQQIDVNIDIREVRLFLDGYFTSYEVAAREEAARRQKEQEAAALREELRKKREREIAERDAREARNPALKAARLKAEREAEEAKGKAAAEAEAARKRAAAEAAKAEAARKKAAAEADEARKKAEREAEAARKKAEAERAEAAAKAEKEERAARRLALAKRLLDDAKAAGKRAKEIEIGREEAKDQAEWLRDRAIFRLRAIIKEYPDTAAAKEAAKLLKDLK